MKTCITQRKIAAVSSKEGNWNDNPNNYRLQRNKA